MSAPVTTLIALLHGPDQRGLVARASGWIFERGGNILHADQHRDEVTGVFFQRLEWIPAAPKTATGKPRVKDVDAEVSEFLAFARDELKMQATVTESTHRPRVALFVSKADHCFHDIILRWRAGEFPCDIVGVISNHEQLASAAEAYGLKFFHLPILPGKKITGESDQLALLKKLKVELVVLARYMQVLSDEFLRQFGKPIINIHHSFLPAFAGGRPYHQAHERGVKLIGATAHYATAVLDDGPIIQQDVARVTHRHSIDDLVRKGKDLEKSVLAQALRWHLENRILVYGNKTVVFD
ncbi:formyltetrahydrofolate deformylase [Oleiharenicola lentus]|uniref:formyltetrahydrofolate deformylase n=1 Tax=Oleiharenicola lentus TaxID=2508720 RepID=UPI003F66FB79